jgi:para-aminobenzoate synthetase component 1
MTKPEFIEALNRMGSDRIPFLFIIDFEFNEPIVIPLNEVDPRAILYALPGFDNSGARSLSSVPTILRKHPIAFQQYEQKFEKVFAHLCHGDTYLTNLTLKTEIGLSGDLADVFYAAKAPYKLLYKNQFLVFSPECFVRIRNGKIYTYPMKGTIDAAIPDARSVILQSPKELAEHVTIVDLLRNDLSQVASHVEVSRFRYIEKIMTNQKNLLQVSSEIRGVLPENFRSGIGSILATLLPAGSVSGAPKPRTTKIIASAEVEPRGYYTGIFGVFDGTDLDSGVMIRYIERRGDKYFYRSGGGITAQSSVEQEYQEVLDKVYLPIE